ncbi:MAG: Hpt domain-containing protein [Cyclobacteriaceae bacterium]
MSTEKISIDLDFLQSIAGSKAKLIELLETFKSKIPIDLNALNEYIQENNWSKVEKLAHKVRPNFSYLGAHPLANLVEEVEYQASGSQDKDFCEKTLNTITEDYTIICKLIDEQLIKLKNE